MSTSRNPSITLDTQHGLYTTRVYIRLRRTHLTISIAYTYTCSIPSTYIYTTYGILTHTYTTYSIPTYIYTTYSITTHIYTTYSIPTRTYMTYSIPMTYIRHIIYLCSVIPYAWLAHI